MIHVHAGTCICMFSFVWVGATSLPIISSCAMHIFSHMSNHALCSLYVELYRALSSC